MPAEIAAAPLAPESAHPASLGHVYAVGTVLTLALAAALVVADHPVAAGAVLLVSPFPCPPGVPC